VSRSDTYTHAVTTVASSGRRRGRYPAAASGGRLGVLTVFLVALSLIYAPARAQGLSAPVPKTLVILTSRLTWDDMRPDGDLNVVRRLASEGGAALLSPTVAGEATDAAAYLTLGAGERVAAPDRRGPTINVSSVPLTVADIAAESYPANLVEGNAVRPVYVRRFGVNPPANAVAVDIGLPTLQRIQGSPERAALLGAFGDAMLRARRRVAVYGDWRSVVVAMDHRGAVYHGSAVTDLAPNQLREALAEADVIIASVDAGQRPLRLLTQAALPLVRRREINLLIVSAAPPLDPNTGRWERPGFLIAAGPAFTSHSLLTSPTTRTPGLVANVDLCPTLLRLQRLPPLPGGTGNAIHSVRSVRIPAEAVANLDRHVTATENALVPVLAGYGAFAIATLIAALITLLRAGESGRPPAASIITFALRLALAAPLAFLLLGRFAPEHIGLYGGLVAALAVILTLLTDLVGGWRDIPAAGLLLLATAGGIGIDALFGSPCGVYALPAGYWATGSRFYGVGPAFLGIAIGAVVTSMVALRWERILLLFGGGLVLALGLPWCGANTTGAIVAVLTIALAVCALRDRGLRARHVVLGLVCSALAALLLSAVDHRLHLAARAQAGLPLIDPGALVEAALGKAERGIGSVRAGWMLAALAGIAPVAALFASAQLRGRAGRALAATRLGYLLPAMLWGAVAAAVFVEGGITAGLLLLAPPALLVVHEMLNG